jgi:hypothetical protein
VSLAAPPRGGGVSSFGPRSRAVLLAAGGLALLSGLLGALALLGQPVPPGTVRLAASHGLLMTFGFLGTLVSLERAVALGRRWGYVAPLAAAAGAVALVAADARLVAAAFFVIAGLGYVAIYVAFDRIERSLHGAVQAAGAVAWLGGALLLVLAAPIANVVPWLAAFLVLTIVGERLELSRVVRPPRAAHVAFVLLVAVFGAGVAISAVSFSAGARIAGAGMVAMAAWLGRYDIARRTIRAKGVTRFIAASLLPGYLWLGIAGAVWLAVGAPAGTAAYDAWIHALFLGFVISMVFGHAPIILPAVLRITLPYRPRFYLHLGLLHAGLLLRIVGGDLLALDGARTLGGVLNVFALLLFLTSSVAAVVEGAGAERRRTRARPTPRDAAPRHA